MKQKRPMEYITKTSLSWWSIVGTIDSTLAKTKLTINKMLVFHYTVIALCLINYLVFSLNFFISKMDDFFFAFTGFALLFPYFLINIHNFLFMLKIIRQPEYGPFIHRKLYYALAILKAFPLCILLMSILRTFNQ